MDNEIYNVDHDQPSTDLVATDLDAALPMLASGDLNWKALMPMEANPTAIGALISREFNELSETQTPHAQQQASRIKRSAAGIIDLYADGHLSTMGDAFEVIELVKDRNPQIANVAELMENGLNAADTSLFYAAKDELGTTLEVTRDLFRILNFDFRNESDIATVATAIEVIQTELNIPYVDTASKKLLACLVDGKILGEILDGKV